jgi:hypothetical protein
MLRNILPFLQLDRVLVRIIYGKYCFLAEERAYDLIIVIHSYSGY